MKGVPPGVWVTAAGLLIVTLAACSAALPDGARDNRGESAAGQAARPPLPTIDGQAVVDTETATFALG